MYSTKELDNISCSCLLACALLDFAKDRARSARAKNELRFFGAGRDRFVLDFLHERHLSELKNFRLRRIIREAVSVLFAEFSLKYQAAHSGFWTALAADFEREYISGRVNLFEINWE